MIEGEEVAVFEGLLRELLPEACAIVGKSNVRDIARLGGDIQLAPLDGASRMDWTSALTMLAAAASVLSNGLVIAKAVSDRKKKSQSEISLEIKLALPQGLGDKLDPAMVDKLLSGLVMRL